MRTVAHGRPSRSPTSAPATADSGHIICGERAPSRRARCAATLLLAVALIAALPRTALGGGGSPLEESGDLAALVLDYRETLPGRNSHRFVEGHEDEVAAIAAAAQTALAGDLDAAAAMLDPLGYDLVLFEDPDRGGAHLILRERVPCLRCWGLYVISLSPWARNTAVEVPHPIFDGRTEEMGIEAFLTFDAGAFFMAGTHRYANGDDSETSDMARNPASLFQHMHEALTNVDTQVLQYHGFVLGNHPGYPNVVLSNGGPMPQPELYTLAAALEDVGESAGVYDGVVFADLGATENPQGQHTRAIGGRFYHMEHRATIRNSAARRTAVIQAAQRALFLSTAVPVPQGR